MALKKVFFSLPVCSSRWISTSCSRSAGFQGSKANIPLEMKLRMIERKKRRVEKLSKQPLAFIPITDFFIPYSWKMDKRARSKLEISEEEEDKRVLLEKEWARKTFRSRKQESWKIKLLLRHQQRALEELRQESEKLYNAALQCEDLSIPFTCRGPVQSTPLEGYLPPLGGYEHTDPLFSKDDLSLPEV
ncbi:unnamed protein product [Clavelina lepadiformis]|uniref:Large ribosomal subunit protein mL40 n=1 Tax=Clavelina lepadiformis TaxID=159417 RepID=A0ABP0FD92_CLALP